jgi:hypothetical protein
MCSQKFYQQQGLERPIGLEFQSPNFTPGFHLMEASDLKV